MLKIIYRMNFSTGSCNEGDPHELRSVHGRVRRHDPDVHLSRQALAQRHERRAVPRVRLGSGPRLDLLAGQRVTEP